MFVSQNKPHSATHYICGTARMSVLLFPTLQFQTVGYSDRGDFVPSNYCRLACLKPQLLPAASLGCPVPGHSLWNARIQFALLLGCPRSLRRGKVWFSTAPPGTSSHVPSYNSPGDVSYSGHASFLLIRKIQKLLWVLLGPTGRAGEVCFVAPATSRHFPKKKSKQRARTIMNEKTRYTKRNTYREQPERTRETEK